MKVAVTAKGKTLDDQVDPRFGRCPYFLVVDTETLETQAVENPNVALGGGAGIQSAQLMAQHDVKVVLTGNCGPNAYQTLNAAEIEIVVGAAGSVREAVERFNAGTLSSTQGPNVASHFGMGVDAGGQTLQEGMTDIGGGTAMARGMGGGGGGGMGGGMGMGGGRGMGRGMGMGGGRGMGRGMGMGGGMAGAPFSAPGSAGNPEVSAVGSEIDVLKAEAQNLEAQLEAVKGRMDELAAGGPARKLIAAVDAEKCTGCGVCERVCPENAISVKEVAIIDKVRCTGCGRCVSECPAEALTLKKG